MAKEIVIELGMSIDWPGSGYQTCKHQTKAGYYCGRQLVDNYDADPRCEKHAKKRRRTATRKEQEL